MQPKRITVSVAVVSVLTLLLVARSTMAGSPTHGNKVLDEMTLAGTVASQISYQGRLTDANGVPLNGPVNLVFQLWDDATAGSQIGSDITSNGVSVKDGLFTVQLAVPQDAFYGRAVWLQISVNGQTLNPRQELLPVPYALGLKPGAHVHSNNNTTALTASNESNGYGLHASTAGNIAILGESSSSIIIPRPAGMVGVYGVGDGKGVYGWSDNTGVYGESPNGNGVKGQSSNNDGVVGSTDASDKSGVYGYSDNGVGVTGRSSNDDGIFGATFSSDAGHAGVFGRNNGAGPGVYGIAGGTSGVGVLGVGSTGVLAESTGGTALRAVVTSGYGDGIYAESGPSGGYAADLKGNVQIRSRSTGATVIELGEGLDYAEGFDVSDETAITPGSVLIIDPDNPGQLTLSNTAYDHRVAGIVAGANELGSAVRLGPGQFDYDVALAGRVYCNVDATYGSVEPGDLLTTSPTPGYAMKVSDYTEAQGTILGKAMERLEEGRKGQILVLVTLQ